MIIHEKRKRPLPWREQRARSPHAAFVPLLAFDWGWEWVAYVLSHWNFLEVLEYLGSFSVLIAVIFYFTEAPDRAKQKHYQAWQVINTAQGKGGSGGRIDALQELNADGISLTGVDVSQAFLQGVQLPKAQLARANFNAVDARESRLDDSDFAFADLQSANFRGSSLKHVSLRQTDLRDADLNRVDLSGSDLSGAVLDNADLRFTDLSRVRWNGLKSVKDADVFGAKNAPDGFIDWALRNGAVQAETDDTWRKLVR
jgi:Pentapeptide repeats (8 copies)